jgi:hypothetical protein
MNLSKLKFVVVHHYTVDVSMINFQVLEMLTFRASKHVYYNLTEL